MKPTQNTEAGARRWPSAPDLCVAALSILLAHTGNLKVAELLLETRADPNVKSLEKDEMDEDFKSELADATRMVIAT